MMPAQRQSFASPVFRNLVPVAGSLTNIAMRLPACSLRPLAMLLIAMLGWDPVPLSAAEPMSPDEIFESFVRPVLVGRCFRCHGGEKTEQGLRVDSREALLRGGQSGPAMLPGQPDDSLLLQAIERRGDLQMPPDDPLPPGEIEHLRVWIREGAHWPDKPAPFTPNNAAPHWAWQPLGSMEPPPRASAEESNHPIDRFLAERWRAAGVEPSPEAPPRVLARRLYFDLTGLPPTPDDLEDFLTEDAPDAVGRLVDRLLASPRYGERWGRHWLDVARYADTAGDNADYPVPEAIRYRDYVLDAFQRDKPIDRFLIEQLAGDLLAPAAPPPEYAEPIAATGFLALSRRYATGPYELWHLTLEDTLDTLGKAYLGLSLRCARCHDHKYDPITSREYYALYGIFASTQFPYAGSEELVSKNLPRSAFVPIVPPAQAAPFLRAQTALVNLLKARVASIERDSPPARALARLEQVSDATAGAANNRDSSPSAPSAGGSDAEGTETRAESTDARRKALRQALDRLLNEARRELRHAERPGLPTGLPAAYAVQDGTAADVALHVRGEPAEPGPVIPRNAPAILGGERQPLEIPAGQSGRLQLALRLVDPQHPLAARVFVNRVWQHHFGRGLVATPSNFGRRGEPPTHPELLDWLTARFMADGWSLKSLHRLILSSRAYRLASTPTPSAWEHDPGNRLLARFPRRRLEAEEIRDALLAVSGQLNLDRPGPHPFPPIDEWGWTQHQPFKSVYESRHRSVYLMTQRLQRHPFLALFDGPDTNNSTDLRTEATVPLQALYWMNHPFVHDCARAFVHRLATEEPDPAARYRLAQSLAWGRPADTDEAFRAGEFLATARARLSAEGVTDPAACDQQAWAALAQVLFAAHEFIYVD